MALWLIGPREQDPLDTSLQLSLAGLPFEARMFSGQDDLGALIKTYQPDGVLLLEPLTRVLPEGIWQIELPLVGLCSSQLLDGVPPAQVGRLLSALDGVIPLDHKLRALVLESVPESVPVSRTLWVLGPQHRPSSDASSQRAALFASGYLLTHNWSPKMARCEQLAEPPNYFIRMHPGRLPFYFQRVPLLLSDESLHSGHLQALACGASLLLHRESEAAADLSELLTAGQDFLVYDDASLEPLLNSLTAGSVPRPRADLARLNALRLEQALPAALAELADRLKPGTARLTDPFIESLQHCGVPHPLSIWRLRQLIEHLPPGEQRIAIELCFYLRLVTSAYSQTDPAQIHPAVDARLQHLPLGPDRELIRLSALMVRNQPGQALTLVRQLLHNPPKLSQLRLVASWHKDALLLELAEQNPEQALLNWLRYLEALCLASLNQTAEAVQALEALIDTHYFVSGVTLWLNLQARLPVSAQARQAAGRWLELHPQNLDLARFLIQALSQDRSAALALCQRYQDLSRRHLTRAQELERFLALERSLQPDTSALAAAASGTVHLLWEGPLHSHSSLASINARWMLRLSHEPDMHVGHIPYGPPDLAPEPETAVLEQRWLSPVDVFVSHRWPPRNEPPSEGKWASIIPWEFGVIPESWTIQLNAQLDRIWVPSQFVAQSFVISGVRPELLSVIPNGVDTAVLRPEGDALTLKTAKSNRFLFVGGMLERKGLDILLDAYSLAFTAADDVCLVIKGFGSDSHYAMHPFQTRIQALQTTPDAPEILYLEDDLSAEQMAELFRACQAYVHPYRGEGFGMPILEAMACGLPVLIPNAGPAPEFCPLDAGWQVPTRIRFEGSRDVQGMGLSRGYPYYTEVDITALAETLRAVLNDPQERRRRGQNAAQAARGYDWEQIFPLLKREISELAKRPVARYLRGPEPVDSGLLLRPDRWLIDRPLPAQLSEKAQELIWYSHPDQREELSARGYKQLQYQPLAVNFKRFSPDIAPLVLEESLNRFVFLTIFDWERDAGWQDLLTAYFSVFQESDPVNLVFKPLSVRGTDFETMLDTLMDWITAQGFDPETVPGLTFVQEDLTPETLPGLYRGADCFVAAHAVSGAWHLLAQASGVPVISCGHFLFLERPFSEVFRPGDISHLAWLLRQHQDKPDSGRGRIVRECLEAVHGQNQSAAARLEAQLFGG